MHICLIANFHLHFTFLHQMVNSYVSRLCYSLTAQYLSDVEQLPTTQDRMPFGKVLYRGKNRKRIDVCEEWNVGITLRSAKAFFQCCKN